MKEQSQKNLDQWRKNVNPGDKINKNSILRLLRYKNALRRFKTMGLLKVYSDNLADALGIKPTQVRKDFSLFGLTGNKRGGYKLEELQTAITAILGKDRTYEVVLVGLGNIGQALVNYKSFEDEGIKIIAAFDIDPEKYKQNWRVPAFDMEELPQFIREKKVELGIIATPDLAAQRICDLMVSAGVKGILNFAPIRLRSACQTTIINNVNLVQELENIIFFVNSAREEEQA